VSEAPHPGFDRARLVELFGEDAETIAEIEREFIETVRAAEREISGAADLAGIARAAHRVKGASGMIGANDLHKVAEALERSAATGDRPGVRCLQTIFSEEVRRIAEHAGPQA